MRKAKMFSVIATAALLSLAVVGCSSHPKEEKEITVNEPADLAEQNRLLVRMALAENVYNSVATERAVYSKDFKPGTAALNALGERRVEMIIDSSRGATGQVVVVRGNEPDDVYKARVVAVREELADAGIDLNQMVVGEGGHAGGEGISSGRAIVTYDRMMKEYATSPKSNSSSGSFQGTSLNSDSSKGK